MRNHLKLGTSGLFIAGGGEAGHFPRRAGVTQDDNDESHGSNGGGRMYNRQWPGSHKRLNIFDNLGVQVWYPRRG